MSKPDNVLQQKKQEKQEKVKNLSKQTEQLKKEIKEVPKDQYNPEVEDATDKLVGILELHGERINELEEEIL